MDIINDTGEPVQFRVRPATKEEASPTGSPEWIPTGAKIFDNPPGLTITRETALALLAEMEAAAEEMTPASTRGLWGGQLGVIRRFIESTDHTIPVVNVTPVTDAHDRLVPLLAGALLSACKMAADDEGPEGLVHAQWREVNRVAGAIAGYVASLDPVRVDQARLAGHMMEDVQESFLALLGAERELAADVAHLDPGSMPAKIVGPNGLAKRLAHALAAFGVRP